MFRVRVAIIVSLLTFPALSLAEPAPPATNAPAPLAVPSKLPGDPVPIFAAPPEEKVSDRVLSPGEVDLQVFRNKEDEQTAPKDIFPTRPGEVPKEENRIPTGLADRVEKFIRYFQTAGRDRFELYLQRSGKYAELMSGILGKYGLPDDLIYLALIESGFSPKAYSVAKAAGPWQFIAETGKRYGLRIDWWTDERRDYEKSTHAAASYLKDLHGLFDSWPLAAAAYNAGEGKIMRAVSRYHSEDYTELIRHKYLKQETKDYVPKMLAALTIGKEPEKYGFGDVRIEPPLEFDKVEVPGGTDLAALGAIIGVPYDSLREWNPELKRFCTPPNKALYELRVPKTYGQVVEERMDEIREDAKVTFLLHTAKKGETLDGLAAKYRSDAAILKELNGLKKYGIGRSARLIIPVTGLSGEDAVPGKEVSPEQLEMAHMRIEEGGRKGGSRGRLVRVRKGDTLVRIARRTGVTVEDLAGANGLSTNAKVSKGVRLRIPGKTGAVAKVRRAGDKHVAANDADGRKPAGKKGRLASSGKKKPQRHVVRKGETLDKIARAYGVSPEEISDRNRLKAGQSLRRGRVLRIPAES